MRTTLLFISLLLMVSTSRAGRISGTVTDDKGQVLSFATILVKGTGIGTTANKDGQYFLTLDAGQYTISCQYVGYNRVEKKVTVAGEALRLDFQLSLQQLSMAEVVVRAGGEDPAYGIIRQAIKKRPFYLEQSDKFQCEVYIKGQFRLRNYPKKFMGENVDFEDGDTSKRKMLYLSETVARYSVDKPRKAKIEVLSTKVSGSSSGFGLSAPQILSFYENNISIGSNLNPRGFISPIANNALSFYRYKLEGVFFEDGKEINRIQVIPKRKFEPLFSGYINITEGDWRIHSVQLQLTKESQMQLLDTMRIEQLYAPLDNDVWVIKTQVIYPAIKFLGFDAFGSFVNIYSKFDVNPSFASTFFNNTILRYTDSSNKKPAAYWDSIRPVPLQLDEVEDYRKKDSLEIAHKDPRYLDSIDQRRNRYTFNAFVSGKTFTRQKKREWFAVPGITSMVSYNTVEGAVINMRLTYGKRLDSTAFSRGFNFTPVLRYGFSNQHFNAYGIFNYNFGSKYSKGLSLAGGKRVFQFNNANPIHPYYNSVTTLLYERNYMKIYEAWFARVGYYQQVGDGITLTGSVQYQDRLALENTTGYNWRNFKDKIFSPNYPEEIMTRNFERHQALSATVGVNWRPGTRYIEFPDRKFDIGSRYPTLSASYTQGINNLLGSDVQYSKWSFGIRDNLNLKLKGLFRYNVGIGGFLNSDSVPVIDYTHFKGNRVITAGDHLQTFQLLPYYQYSNTAPFYATAHVEHHFNGLLTNKIPLFRRLNWYLVGGYNGLYVNSHKYYSEVVAGLENVLKIIRFDIVWGIEPHHTVAGFRISFTGFGPRAEDD